MTDNFINNMAPTTIDKDSLPIIPSDDIEILIWPGEHNVFGMGMRFTAPPPLGTVVVPLTGPQLVQLHAQMARLLDMTTDEVKQLAAQIRGDGDAR